MQILKRRQRIARSLRSRAGWRLERAIERRQRKARSLRSRAGWRLERAIERRQRIARSLSHAGDTPAPPTAAADTAARLRGGHPRTPDGGG